MFYGLGGLLLLAELIYECSFLFACFLCSLDMQLSMKELSSPTRDPTRVPCIGNTVLTPGLPGKCPVNASVTDSSDGGPGS